MFAFRRFTQNPASISETRSHTSCSLLGSEARICIARSSCHRYASPLASPRYHPTFRHHHHYTAAILSSTCATNSPSPFLFPLPPPIVSFSPFPFHFPCPFFSPRPFPSLPFPSIPVPNIQPWGPEERKSNLGHLALNLTSDCIKFTNFSENQLYAFFTCGFVHSTFTKVDIM